MAHAYVPSQGHAARFPAVNLYRLHRFLNPDCLPQKSTAANAWINLGLRWMRRLAPCGLGGDRGAELRHGAPDFAPNRKDFKHQGRPEHLLWVHVNCQELLTDPLTDPQGHSIWVRV